MPYPLLAHQGVVLPLARWRPRWFDATALCIGSVAPDLEYLGHDKGEGVGHSLGGQVLFCLPITLLATLAVQAFVAPVLASRVPGRVGSLFARVPGLPRDVASAARVTVSALIGSASHVALDGLTHANGWGPRTFHGLSLPVRVLGLETRADRLVQYGLSAVLALVTAVLVAGTRRREVPPTRRRRGFGVLALAAVGGGIAGYRASRGVLADGNLYFHDPRLHAVGYVAFSVACAAFAAVAVAAVPFAWLDAAGRTDRPASATARADERWRG